MTICDITLALTAAMSLYQGYQENQTAKANADYQEQVGIANERKLENQATETRNEGVREENKIRRDTAELQGDQLAAFGARGVDTGSGSALQLQKDTASLGEADALSVRENYRSQAAAQQDSARIGRWQSDASADQTRDAGKSALVGGALSAAGAVASKWFTPKSSFTQSQKLPSGGGAIHLSARGV